MSSARRRQSRHRSGVLLLTVLVMAFLASTLIAIWARSIVVERQALRRQEDRLQAVWLAEAALERASAQLAANPAYAGETWTVAPAELAADRGEPATAGTEPASPDRGAIEIVVERSAERPRQALVRVTVEYPAQNPRRLQRYSKRAPHTLKTPAGESS